LKCEYLEHFKDGARTARVGVEESASKRIFVT